VIEDQPVVDQVVTAEPVENRRLMSTRLRRRPRMERPVLRASRDLRPADGWVPPEIGGLQNRYGSSLLDEFVLGHSTSDVLTELVQNEFDAEGTRLDVALGRSALRVTGNGKVIDAKGWKRLSVVLGTGETVGPDGLVETVPPKANGLGSKNFGLRSLFLFGDRVHIRSGGKLTVKDRFAGSPPRPLADPTSRNRSGVLIDVPFRDRPTGRLGPFTVEREREMLDTLLDNLQHTVVKLAQPGSRRNLTTVVVTSERCDRRIAWTQAAERVTVHQSGVTAVQRTVRVQDSASGGIGRGSMVLTEIEFLTAVPSPGQHTGVDIPSYFQASAGRMRLGVSVRLQRGRIDLGQPGLFYYPLGLRHGFSGTAVSVNAPFLLDQDRTRVVASDWNKWLLEQAADLTIALLTGDWRVRFGAAAFLALKPLSTPSHPRYMERLAERLKKDACWPTRATGADGRPILQPAGQIVVPERREFDGFLSAQQYLNDSLVDHKTGDAVQALARGHGALAFGLNSLIRLRCAGEKADTLATQLDGQANYYYSNYEVYLRDVDRQRQFAAALEAVRPRLTDKHRLDLRNSPATLAADGSLHAPKDLLRVDPSLGDACPVPPSRRLHPALLAFKAIADRCEPFEEVRWATDLAQRVKDGAADADEREALSRYVLSKRGQLRRSVIAALRDAPILRDHRGAWVVPADITSRRTPGAADLEPVLHFPHPDYAEDRALESRFRFRRRLAGPDLIAMARFVAEHPERAEAFEVILRRRRALLTGSVLATLADIPFLRSSAGGLDAPRNLYLRNAVTVASLGGHATFVVGSRLELYRALSCSERPRPADIVAHLSRLAQDGRPPARPEIVYPALVSALRSEGTAPTMHKMTGIVWTERGYRSPDEILVGSRFPRSLLAAVPHVRGPDRLVDALQALGAHAQPLPHHWRALFTWFGQQYRQTGGPVTEDERAALRDAYRRRGRAGLPEGVGSDVRCLLGRDRRVYSRADVAGARFVINDDPVLADAITEQGARLAFADTAEASQELFSALNVPLLTAVVGQPEPRIGEERGAPPWFKPAQALERLHSEDFASALAAIGRAHARANSTVGIVSASAVARRLARIRDVVFVQDLELIYRVSRAPVVVRKEVWLGDARISLVWVGSRRDLDQLLAQGLAQILTAAAGEQQRLADAIYCLLTCRTSAEMATYLRRRGIPWEPPSNDVVDVDDEGQTEQREASDASEAAALVTELARRVIERAASGQPAGDQRLTSQHQPEHTHEAPPASLPPLEAVTLQPLAASVTWAPPERRGTRSGGGRWGWSPRTQSDVDRDEAVGLQAEALVYRAERARVRVLGFDEARVVWTAEHDRTADHDIRSVDEDGTDLWIEVKSTTGRDGRFEWSVAEFEKAVREGKRYELWRVYDAGTTTPTYKRFRDPMSLVRAEKIKMDIASFWAEVEPMDA